MTVLSLVIFLGFFAMMWRSYGFVLACIGLVGFTTLGSYIENKFGILGTIGVIAVFVLLIVKAWYDGPRPRSTPAWTGKYGYGPGDVIPPSHKTPGGPGDPCGTPPP